MPVDNTQINLQTTFSKLSTAYYLLKIVKDNEPVTCDDTRDNMFPQARSKLKSRGNPWSPTKKDTHTRISFEEYGLIDYDESNPDYYSVSDLGNELLNSFDFNENVQPDGLIDPIVTPKPGKQDDISFLFWKIACSTFIHENGFSIHPYRILFVLLARPVLKGFITKDEWAKFLLDHPVGSDDPFRKDDDLSVIESALSAFRNSTDTFDIRSTDRVLGRLTDWGYLEVVENTSGDKMAYRLSKGFKWVVKSNLTLKEQDMDWNDTMFIKSLFVDWAGSQPSQRGIALTSPVVQHYAYELENDLNDPEFVSIKQGSLFAVCDPNEFSILQAAIKSTASFGTYDSAGYFSRALTLYDQFLRDPEVQRKIALFRKVCPHLAAIRTKPFILLAGISGTGKSRMVRQLARGCCPRYNPGTTVDHPLYDEQKPGNFEMIQVRPNWHDSTELIGYISRITKKSEYQLTDFVRFLAKAWLFPEVPFFLCLDEMNLAPVEQYFAEYLSVIETRTRAKDDVLVTESGGSTTFVVQKKDEIRTDVLVKFGEADAGETVEKLLKEYWDVAWNGKVNPQRVSAVRAMFEADKGVRIPPNLVVMGTVNMDETTCTFSRKVLDRAMSFELNEVDMDEGLDKANETDFGSIAVEAATPRLLNGHDAWTEDQKLCEKVKDCLVAVNGKLDKTPFKIAYRSRDEIMVYCLERTKGREDMLAQALDEATSMKILSRIEGDENRFKSEFLENFQKTVALGLLRVDNPAATEEDAKKKIQDDEAVAETAKRSPSLSKLGKMISDLYNIGAVSFWD